MDESVIRRGSAWPDPLPNDSRRTGPLIDNAIAAFPNGALGAARRLIKTATGIFPGDLLDVSAPKGDWLLRMREYRTHVVDELERVISMRVD